MFILILIYVCYILGVYKVLSNLDDFNNLRDTGKYLVTNTNALNSPVNAYQYVIVSASGSKQISMPDNSSKVFIRTYYSDNWTPWVEVSYDIPSFYKSYQNLASLANALGVDITSVGNYWTNDYDPSALPSSYYTNSKNRIKIQNLYGGSALGAPTDNGIVITLNIGTSAYQIIIRLGSSDIFIRNSGGGSSWSSWSKITPTVVS